MSRNSVVFSCILISFSASEVLSLGYTNDSFVGQRAGRLTTFLQNLDTGTTALFSHIPFEIFNTVRSTVLQPIIGLVSNGVESYEDVVTNKRSKGRLDKVQFRLYSNKRDNTSFQYLVPEDDVSFRNANFSQVRPLKILIHGFQAAGTYEFPQKTKDAYLEHTDFNVIIVDWRSLSYPPVSFANQIVTYLSSVNSTPFIARRTADLIVALSKNGIIISPDEIHLVGFSLGAQVSGQTGYLIQQRMGSKLGRISALEPASPLFETQTLEMRIDDSDATFVDVIHTSRLSMYRTLGHADFYVNGGRNQPGCYDGFNALQNIRQFLNDVRIQCSHEYGYEIFTWSIGNRNMIGCSCTTWAEYKRYCKNDCNVRAVMGEFCPTSARGSYFLETQLPQGFNVNNYDQS